MAGQFTGMDVAGVRQLATQMRAKADEIRNLSQQLSSQLESTQWVGNDQIRFKGEWTGTHVAALNNVANGLEAAAQAADQNATQQENASNS